MQFILFGFEASIISGKKKKNVLCGRLLTVNHKVRQVVSFLLINKQSTGRSTGHCKYALAPLEYFTMCIHVFFYYKKKALIF